MLCCCNEKSNKINSTQEFSVLEKLKINDIPLKDPKSGEWLSEQTEKGQTFDQYQKLKPLHPTSEKNKIYIIPIGKFNKDQTKILKITCEYIKATRNKNH